MLFFILKTFVWSEEKQSKCTDFFGYFRELPYDVSTDQAMKHEEVKKRVEGSIAQLRSVTESFMNAIVGSIDEIP